MRSEIPKNKVTLQDIADHARTGKFKNFDMTSTVSCLLGQMLGEYYSDQKFIEQLGVNVEEFDYLFFGTVEPEDYNKSYWSPKRVANRIQKFIDKKNLEK